MRELPSDVQKFLETIVRHYALGSRGIEFADWVAAEAIFLLEFRGLYPPPSEINSGSGDSPLLS
jgi:hypothetical protein